MKKLRKNSGFTLVECVVAMAVLAIMTLGLLMILSLTIKQRNQNMQLEQGLDNQVEQLGNGSGTAEDIDGDINIGGFTISGAQKVSDGSDSSIGQISYKIEVEYDESLLEAGAGVTGGSNGQTNPDTTPPPTTNNGLPDNRKVYGSTHLAGDSLTLSPTGAEQTKGGDYIITWKIILQAESIKEYGSNNDEMLMGVESVKIALPSEAEILSYTSGSSGCKYLHLLSNNTLRIEFKGTEEVKVEVKLRLDAKYCEDYVDNEGEFDGGRFITDYFGDTTVKMVTR